MKIYNVDVLTVALSTYILKLTHKGTVKKSEFLMKFRRKDGQEKNALKKKIASTVFIVRWVS